MAWIPFALAAAPSIYQMFQPKPQMPGMPNYGSLNLPDRSRYQQMILDSAFNPQSDLYQQALRESQSSVASQLASRGLLDSTGGAQLLAGTQGQIASKFLENEMQRRIAAFQAATGHDVQKAELQSGLMGRQGEADMNRYNMELAQQQRQADMYGGLAQAGAGAWNAQLAANQADLDRQENNRRWDQYMGRLPQPPPQPAPQSQSYYNPAPTGGMYSYAPSYNPYRYG